MLPIGFEEARRALEGIPNAFPKAAADAINRGLTAGRELASQSIYANYNIGQGEAKAHLKMNKASWGGLSGSLEAKSTMFPLNKFKPSVITRRAGPVVKGRRTGAYRQLVRVSVVRGGKKDVPGAFQIPDGRIMERRQPSKYPIFPVSAIGVAHMLGALRVGTPVSERMAEITYKRLMANMQLFLAQGAAKWPSTRAGRAESVAKSL